MSRLVRNADDMKSDPVAAEAAAWLVKLQHTPREAGIEAAFRAWLSGDEARVAAFSKATDVWEALGGVAPLWAAKTSRRRHAQLQGLAAAACVAVAAAWGLGAMDPAYSTKVGEQRLVRLKDGTVLTLNTSTAIKVDYSSGSRRIELKRGEAYFDVAHDSSRPFIVKAGAEEVRALGTTFLVRRGSDKVEVTLFSGVVDVSKVAETGQDTARPITLSPGQRLQVTVGRHTIDRPRLEAVTAWRYGELLLDQTPIAAATAEMNRYNRTPIVFETQPSNHIRITGVLKTGDSRNFARTVSTLYGMELEETKGRYLLKGSARSR